ncbi:MAG: FkbM family methyltransferase [Acetobacteraceae bacterium]
MMIDHAQKLDPVADTAFARFRPWNGTAPAGYDVNWLGQMTDVRFVAGWDDEARSVARHYDPAPYPALGEETFEWLTMLDAVLEARGSFTMIEGGAGFGRWLVAAALALRQAHPGVPCQLVGVEGDPEHYRCLLQHFRDHRLDTNAHRLIHGAVGDTDGAGRFALNDDHTGWWGQWLMREDVPLAGQNGLRTEPIQVYSLATLIEPHDRIDYLDIDIQGAEGTAVPAAIDAMTRKVRRCFVETHSAGIHRAVYRAFPAEWECQHCYGFVGDAKDSTDRTPFGPIQFQAGVQCWRNRSLL